MRIRLALLGILVALATSAAAQSRAAGVQMAFARAQHLRHGINASGWFAQAGDYSAAHTDRYTDAQDIALMAKLGFDHVRLSIDPVPLAMSMYPYRVQTETQTRIFSPGWIAPWTPCWPIVWR